jgi:multimeric flavodoxin WrbA
VIKVGAAVVTCRRGGNTATFDVLNKYFTKTGMPVASSQYWNMVYGGSVEEVAQDAEGLQTMRTLGHNMAFMMKSFQLGKKQIGLPQKEPLIFTNFHR